MSAEFLGFSGWRLHVATIVGFLFAGLAPIDVRADEPAVAEIPGGPWERTIVAFEEKDRVNPPKPGSVLFLGSSSIRLWKLEETFPEAHAVNRGFGGSQIADSVKYAERVVVPHQPRLIVFYAGDNDVASGKSAERVVGDFSEFLKIVHAKLPETRVAFIAIKPCPSRWKQFSTQSAANRMIAEIAESDPRLQYIDVVAPMLNGEGQPRPELFLKDNLHMNAEGYKIWNALVRPLLETKNGSTK